jgi:hypothetical protein
MTKIFLNMANTSKPEKLYSSFFFLDLSNEAAWSNNLTELINRTPINNNTFGSWAGSKGTVLASSTPPV